MVSTASARDAQGRVFSRRGVPPRIELYALPPAPQKRSPVKGWFISPSTGSPASSRPISVPHSGMPVMKARVPSIGSMIQLRWPAPATCGEFLADDAVLRIAGFDRLAYGALGGTVGGGDGVEAGGGGLVADSNRLAKIRQRHLAGNIGQAMRELQMLAQVR